MNFPEYVASVWSDPTFQRLPNDIQLLFFVATAEVDQAGWWAPHLQLVQLQIPGIEDPLDIARKKLAPWITVHPSGFWSLNGYPFVQCPKGIDPNSKSGFVKGLHKKLVVHRARERRVSLDPAYEVEGLGARASASSALDLDVPAAPAVEPAVAQAKAPPDLQSTKSSAPSLKSQVPGPTRGSGGADSQPSDAGIEGDGPVLAVLEAAGVMVVNPAPWMITSLREASRRVSWPVVKAAALTYVAGPGPHSLRGLVDQLPQLLKPVCDHPKALRRHFHKSLDGFPAGLKQNMWACGKKGCDGHGPVGVPRLKRHKCANQVHHGKAIVQILVGDQLVAREVDEWNECGLCGRQTPADGSEGQVAA